MQLDDIAVVHFHRAADQSALCRWVLGLHPEATSLPKHIMSNVCDRFEAEVAEDLHCLLKQFCAECDARTASVTCSAQKNMHHKAVGRAFLKEAWKRLSVVKPHTSAQCERCQTLCPIHPCVEGRSVAPYVITLELNGQEVWMVGRYFHHISLVDEGLHDCLPEAIIHENTSHFDDEVFVLLCGHHYSVQTAAYSPSHMGLPVNRLRKYSVLIRKDCWSSMPFDWKILESIIGRNLATSGRIFYRAPHSMLAQAQVRNHESCNDEDLGADLAAGDQARLREYRDVVFGLTLPSSPAKSIALCWGMSTLEYKDGQSYSQARTGIADGCQSA